MVDNITLYARRLGFEAVGFVPVESFTDAYQQYLWWINQGYYGDMSYLHRHRLTRQTPQLLASWAKTALVVLFPYLPKTLLSPNERQVAKFAYDTDYHVTLKNRLYQLLQYIQSLVSTRGRCLIDTAPLLERSLAVKVGLGWIGKSGMLIHPQWGTYTLIGSILLECTIESESLPQNDLCGDCHRCIDACPGKAIVAPKIIDARQCVSYLTIEYPRYYPDSLVEIKGNYYYGCDVCQDVCPQNRQVAGIDRPDFSLNQEAITRRLSQVKCK